MRTKYLTVDPFPRHERISIGRRGENEATAVVFDVTLLIRDHGAGSAVILVKRNGDTTAYPITPTQADGKVTWLVSSTDTQYAGLGKMELLWYVDSVLAKTIVYEILVEQDIGASSEEPPDPYETWLETLTELAGETEQHAADAENSAEDAETAQAAAEDAATAAGTAKTAAEAAAESMAELADAVDALSQVTTTTTVSDVLTVNTTNANIVAMKYCQWGKLATLHVNWTNKKQLTVSANGAITATSIATFKSGKIPASTMFLCCGSAMQARYRIEGADATSPGDISINGSYATNAQRTIAANTQFYLYAVFLIGG